MQYVHVLAPVGTLAYATSPYSSARDCLLRGPLALVALLLGRSMPPPTPSMTLPVLSRSTFWRTVSFTALRT